MNKKEKITFALASALAMTAGVVIQICLAVGSWSMARQK